jgi:hypothetical protein
VGYVRKGQFYKDLYRGDEMAVEPYENTVNINFMLERNYEKDLQAENT